MNTFGWILGPNWAQPSSTQLQEKLKMTELLLISEQKRAEAEQKRADEGQRAHDQIVLLLEKDNERKLVDLAKFQMQFVTRTVICSMLQLAMPQRNDPGGRLFIDFLSTNVLLDPADPTCSKLSNASETLYQEIRYCAPFRSLKAKSEKGWVAIVKDAFSTSLKHAHIATLDGNGLACGGFSLDQMLVHAFIVASIQKFLIGNNIAILPAMYADVAVLSADFTEEVGRVKGGKFVPAKPSTTPPPRPQPTPPSKKGAKKTGASS